MAKARRSAGPAKYGRNLRPPESSPKKQRLLAYFKIGARQNCEISHAAARAAEARRSQKFSKRPLSL